MGTALPAPTRMRELHRLRSEISRMQRRRSDAPFLPIDPALEGLLETPGLRSGSVYSLSPSPSLLGALLSKPSGEGSWCAVIGMPTLGIEALAGYGVDLTRLILVPDPGPRWLTIASALSEVVPLLAVHPRSRVADADVQRFSARLRDRGCTMLVTGRWPQSEATIRVTAAEWHGLGAGHGLLAERTVTLQSVSRSAPVPRSIQVALPGALGAVSALPEERRPRRLAVLPDPVARISAAPPALDEAPAGRPAGEPSRWAVAG